MTYQEFLDLLIIGMEFVVYYRERKYYISQSVEKEEIYFTETQEKFYTFASVESLLKAPLIEGKTIAEVWEELEVY